MLFIVVRPMRLAGRPVRDYSQGEYTGDIAFDQIFDQLLNRHCRALRLLRHGPGGRSQDILSPLRDATLITFTVRGCTFTGFERVGAQDLAQSWYVQFVEQEPIGVRR